MNIFSYFLEEVNSIIESLQAEDVLPEGLDCSRLTCEPPRDPAHGDLSTNAAMVLSKAAGRKPRDLAAILAERLGVHPAVAAVEVAGPGFINLRLGEAFWLDRLREILAEGVDYGDSVLGSGEAVNVEYVSANPTGPMHVGHARGAVFGDVLASLLQKAGYVVTREYYINDAGAQVDVLARSVHLRYREYLGEEIREIPEGYYPGEYLKQAGEAIARRDGPKWRDLPEESWLPEFRDFAITEMMAMIRGDLSALGIEHDVFVSEKSLVETGRVDEAFGLLQDKGLIYRGVLDPPKGKTPEDWEPREQTLFRSSNFGDDTDRPLQKSDGGWTYFASDIAYHLDKFRRGFANMIDVWGADHGGYVKRMSAAVTALTDGRGALDVKLCQLVHLSSGGQPVKMSKRAGTFVTLRDVVDEVGKDVVRFIMLTRSNDAPLDFDLEKVTEKTRDNPVFYVQYAHARGYSVFRNAQEQFPDLPTDAKSLESASVDLLAAPEEIDLIKRMASWPRIVEAAAIAHEPHRIAFYLGELAAAFHALWNKGNADSDARFIVDSRDMTLARLALVRAVTIVIASGLAVLGVKPVEEMR